MKGVTRVEKEILELKWGIAGEDSEGGRSGSGEARERYIIMRWGDIANGLFIIEYFKRLNLSRGR